MTIVAGLACGVGEARASVGPAAVEASVRARAAADLGVAVSAVEVPFLGMGRALACPEDARVEVVPARGEAWKGLSDVTVTGIRPDGVSCDRLRIRPRVEVWMDVPVAAVAVSAGETVGITQRRMLRSQLQGTPVTPAADGDLEARVPLAAGEPVTLRSVRTTPDARSGDDVTVLVEAGALRIQAPGRLMEDAEVGQAVRVSNLATGAVMTGALVEPGLVRAGGSR